MYSISFPYYTDPATILYLYIDFELFQPIAGIATLSGCSHVELTNSIRL